MGQFDYRPKEINVSIDYNRFSGAIKPVRMLVKEIYDIAKTGKPDDIEKAVQMIYAEDDPCQIIKMMYEITVVNDEEETKKKTIKMLETEVLNKIKSGFKVNQKIYDMIKDAIKFAGRGDFDCIKLYVPYDLKAKNPTVNDVINNPDLVILYCNKNKDTVCQKCGVPPFFIDNEKKSGKADAAEISNHFDGTRFVKVYNLEIKQDPNGEYDVRIR